MWILRLCEVEGCKNKHEARGYCKRHYKSFMKYGNPIQVDLNQEARSKKIKESANKTGRTNMSRDGKCKVKGCDSPIKSRKMCEKHYARWRRTGTSTIKTNYGRIKNCIVIDCDNPHKALGYCDKHYNYNRKYGSPYLPKVIKLCGVEDCYEKHWGKGLCKEHFHLWRSKLKRNDLV